jgi:hypothetical protein
VELLGKKRSEENPEEYWPSGKKRKKKVKY